jgi:hypothetical protein
MQNIKMLTDVVGHHGVWREHEIHEMSDDIAEKWIANGQAEPVTPPKARTSAARRQAAKPRAAGRETHG